MLLKICSPQAKADAMRKEVKALLDSGRKLVILSYEPRTLNIIEDLVRERKDVLIIPSFSSPIVTSLMLFTDSLKFNSGLVDEISGAYLRAASSSPEPYKLQRSFLLLLNMIRSIERQCGSSVSMYTTESDVPEWFLKIFDSVEVI
ncbi:MAG: hypothetical protein LM591_01710 [Candidatus Korarchaeum sp.]|nr:hypothetical protein [Candidatus Korarchaeum sp.]